MSIQRISSFGAMLALVFLVGACASSPGAAPTTAPTTAAPAGTAMPTRTAAHSGTATGGATSSKIALLLPETKTTRYESADRPYFEAKFKQLCPNCQIIYSNANQDANTQLSQFEAGLTNSAKVVVLDPVDSAAAATMADRAQAQG